MVALSLEFADELKTPEIEGKVSELDAASADCIPRSSRFVKPQSPGDSGK